LAGRDKTQAGSIPLIKKKEDFMRPKLSVIPLPASNAGYGLPAGVASRWLQILPEIRPDGPKPAKVYTSQKSKWPSAINCRWR
jgi:hypothetical protein